MSDHAIQIRNLTKSFLNKGTKEEVLKSINVDIERGETIAVIGQSGCGKSTLLNVIGGFETPDSGSVLFEGEKVTSPSRRSVMLFQNYGLLPWRSVQKNVELGLEDTNLSSAERKEKALHYLQMVGLQDKWDRFPHQLSGGMQQRVAIARALAIEPELLLMDEPFGALDTFNRYYLQDELLKIQKEANTTIILVTHDIDEAIYLADRVFIMSTNSGDIQREVVINAYKPRDRSGRDFQYFRKLILEEFQLSSATPSLEYNI
ncbi:ABC transporter ATP-binding protein [Thalassobacillus devorans]|uniref:ABC transporter ATP-binding protein n=1 Tax=Thalassobacillus devorans TaxID=279813 RepID=UPI000A1CE7C7|nr:ABC transporter ATP-binding protein [Thalassobacillus devorans]